MQTVRDYYLKNIGIEQWVLRKPIQRMHEHCLIQGSAPAKLLVLHVTESTADFMTLDMSRPEVSLLHRILESQDLSFAECRWIQCTPQSMGDINTWLTETDPKAVWLTGIAVIDTAIPYVATPSLTQLLQHPTLKKETYHTLRDMLSNKIP